MGLLPIALGISRWWQNKDNAAPVSDDAKWWQPRWGGNGPGPLADLLGMAALTLANGSDNIGVYLPLFAHAEPGE